MGDSNVVQSMSVNQQRKSLGQSGNRDKGGGRPSMRQAVVIPGEIDWPSLEEAKNKELLELINGLAKSMKKNIKKPPLNVIRQVDKDVRNEFRRDWNIEQMAKFGFDLSNYINIRASVVIGINCVAKSMDLFELSAILIEKDVDPPILSKILVPLANSKCVPIIAVSGLNTVFEQATAIRCLALGLKKKCKEVDDHFYPLWEWIREELEITGAEQEEFINSQSPPEEKKYFSNVFKRKGSRKPFKRAKIRRVWRV